MGLVDGDREEKSFVRESMMRLIRWPSEGLKLERWTCKTTICDSSFPVSWHGYWLNLSTIISQGTPTIGRLGLIDITMT